MLSLFQLYSLFGPFDYALWLTIMTSRRRLSITFLSFTNILRGFSTETLHYFKFFVSLRKMPIGCFCVSFFWLAADHIAWRQKIMILFYVGDLEKKRRGFTPVALPGFHAKILSIWGRYGREQAVKILLSDIAKVSLRKFLTQYQNLSKLFIVCMRFY